MDEEAGDSPTTHRKRRVLPSPTKRQAAATAVIAAVVAFLAVIAWNNFLRNTNPFPATIQPVKYTLFYPRTLPAGFYVDRDSFDQTSAVTTYTVTYDGNKKLIFAMQPKPKGFDFDGFQKDSKKLHSSLGDAHAGAVSGHTVVSIPTDNSWLMISVPSDIKTSSLEVVLSDLQAVKL